MLNALYMRDRDNALSNEATYKKAFDFNVKYSKNLKTEVQEHELPAPPSVKNEFLNLISVCIQLLSEFTSGLRQIPTLVNFTRTFRRLLSVYALSARQYLLKDRDFLFQTVTGLNTMRELLSVVRDRVTEISLIPFDEQIPASREDSFFYLQLSTILAGFDTLIERMTKAQPITLNQINQITALTGLAGENISFMRPLPAELVYGNQ